VESERAAALLRGLERIETQCWLEGDAKPFLALLANDATIVAARGAVASPHDVHFSGAAFGALMANQCAQPVRAAFDTQDPSLKFESQRVRPTAQGIVVEQVRVFRGMSALERIQERFVFDVDAGALSIRSIWYYPLSTSEFVGDSFDTERLPELDAKAEQTAEPIDRAYALFFALRYVEASELFCSLATAPSADAGAWVACANSSLFAAQPDRARMAFRNAYRLDPLIAEQP
jgi:hypothetical protein